MTLPLILRRVKLKHYLLSERIYRTNIDRAISRTGRPALTDRARSGGPLRSVSTETPHPDKEATDTNRISDGVSRATSEARMLRGIQLQGRPDQKAVGRVPARGSYTDSKACARGSARADVRNFFVLTSMGRLSLCPAGLGWAGQRARVDANTLPANEDPRSGGLRSLTTLACAQNRDSLPLPIP
jgi:hypothetical protein